MKKPSVKCTIPELSSFIFDCSSFKQAEEYKKSKEALESCATTYGKYRSDLKISLGEMKAFTIPEVQEITKDELKKAHTRRVCIRSKLMNSC